MVHLRNFENIGVVEKKTARGKAVRQKKITLSFIVHVKIFDHYL